MQGDIQVLNFFRQYLASAVHGMKNRLTPLAMNAEILDVLPNPGLDKVAQVARGIVGSLRGALDLMTALPRVTELESDVREIAPGPWLAAAAARAGVRLAPVRESAPIALDAGLWSAAIDEVFKNVVDHGGGVAEAACAVEGDRLRVDIRDRGPGLGDMEAHRALEASRRRDASPGQGIGLARAQLAMLLLGGSITLEPAQPGLAVILEGRLR